MRVSHQAIDGVDVLGTVPQGSVSSATTLIATCLGAVDPGALIFEAGDQRVSGSRLHFPFYFLRLLNGGISARARGVATTYQSDPAGIQIACVTVFTSGSKRPTRPCDLTGGAVLILWFVVEPRGRERERVGGCQREREREDDIERERMTQRELERENG